MGLSYVSCDYFTSTKSEGQGPTLTLFNPGLKPGRVVVAGAAAVHSTIGSQVARQLALDHFSDGLVQATEADEGQESSRDGQRGQRLLKEGFKRANRALYQFGHQLSAGGRVAAAVCGLVIDNGDAAAGRVGSWNVSLLRSGRVFPFFEGLGRAEVGPSLDGYVGAQSLVSVETAVVPLEERDVIVISSQQFNDVVTAELMSIAGDFNFEFRKAATRLQQRLFPVLPDSLALVVVSIGPKTLFLQDPVE